MKKQEYADIEARLAAAVSDLSDRTGSSTGGDVGSAAEIIWEQPVERARGGEWYLKGTEAYALMKAVPGGEKEKRIPLRRIWSITAAAAAVLVFVMFYYINLRTDAVVFLDVNPSVSLEINSRDKVTQALACNADGEKILAEMDLRRTDVDVAVNALIGSMIRNGYLNEVQDTLLLSVDCTNAEKKEVLRQRLSGAINEELMALLGRSSVFDQDVDVDDDLEDLAEKYGITPGKAALIMKLIEKDPSLDFGKLAGMPMNVLAEYLLHDAGIDLRDYTRYLGDDWDDDDEDDWDDGENDRDDDDDDDRKAVTQNKTSGGSRAAASPQKQNTPAQTLQRDYDDDDYDDRDDVIESGYDDDDGPEYDDYDDADYGGYADDDYDDDDGGYDDDDYEDDGGDQDDDDDADD